jgi:diguanylate cyclase (GGDEF)-like protein
MPDPTGGPRHVDDDPGRTNPPVPGDVLIFERTDAGFALVGGSGRGSSWAGIVDVPADEDSLLNRAWRSAAPRRQDGTESAHVVGPYYAKHAAAVPVGERHVVVLGAGEPIGAADSVLIRFAADAVATSDGVSASKLMEDELELVHAIRQLVAYRADALFPTMRHIAELAANALSCDVALVRITLDDGRVVEAANSDPPPSTEIDGTIAAHLDAAARGTPTVEQAGGAARPLLGLDVVSHMALPIGSEAAIGVLALGHGKDRPRGFTSLCQRIGRAVADASELLISQAKAREDLSAERDLLARISGIDPLTGIANRRGWDERTKGLLALANGPSHVLSCDLDGLKIANDRYGHQAGDALIRAAANLLTSSVRESDLVARIGGDEFAVLLVGADAAAAGLIHRRIRRAERRWRVTEFGLAPRLSLGAAIVDGGDLEAARRTADERMYANKRRRAGSGPIAAEGRGDDRRGRRATPP